MSEVTVEDLLVRYEEKKEEAADEVIAMAQACDELLEEMGGWSR